MITESHLLPPEPGARAHLHLSAKKVEIARELFIAGMEGKWEDVHHLITDDCVYEGIAGLEARGYDEMMALGKKWIEFSSDCKAEITNAISMDDYVVCEVAWSGINDGPFNMVAGVSVPEPTYKPFHIKGVGIAEFEGEKIKCCKLLSDALGLLLQIGVIKG